MTFCLFYVIAPPLPPKMVNFSVLPHTKALNITWREGNDGNSPVTMFILEYKVNGGKWKVQYIHHSIYYYVLHNVDYNKEYYFRISAFNEVGRGEPSKVLKVTFVGGMIDNSVLQFTVYASL